MPLSVCCKSLQQTRASMPTCLKAAFYEHIHSLETAKIRKGPLFIQEAENDVEFVGAAHDEGRTSHHASTGDDDSVWAVMRYKSERERHR